MHGCQEGRAAEEVNENVASIRIEVDVLHEQADELDGESTEGEASHIVLGGLKFMLLEEVELDISYSTGLDDAEPESEFAVGLTMTN